MTVPRQITKAELHKIRRSNFSESIRVFPPPVFRGFIGADYGLTVIDGSSPVAQQFADFIMSPESQAILTKHGFTPGK